MKDLQKKKNQPLDIKRELARLRAIERDLASEMRKLSVEKHSPSAQAHYDHVREMWGYVQNQIASLSAHTGIKN
jgi:hypothetical protein